MRVIGLFLASMAVLGAIAAPIESHHKKPDCNKKNAHGHHSHSKHPHHSSVPSVTSTAFPTFTPSTVDAPFPTGTGFSTGLPSIQPSIPTTTFSTASISAAAAPSASPSKLRGINIGNWLILERWMDENNVFSGKYSDAQDQWTYDSIDTDASDIQQHWNTYFTESDVQKIASWGFNAMRIPIGYWAFDNTDTSYNMGAADYLDKALGWAKNAGMKVLIDCHGSPGSQNGQDHSGHAGNVDWQKSDNLQRSTTILQQMVQRYGGSNYSDVVMGMEIVNEPTANSPNKFSTSQSWATDTYNAIQQTISTNSLNKALQIITHDSFLGPQLFVPLLSDVQAPASVTRPTFGVDQHNYQLYTDDDNALDQAAHIAKACGWGTNLKTTQAKMPMYVGEWSALTNVNVNPDGSTFGSGKGDCEQEGCMSAVSDPSQWSDAVTQQVRRYVEAQLDTFEANSDGWFIWSYKAGGGWGVGNLIEAGAFPQPLTERKYPGQCS